MNSIYPLKFAPICKEKIWGGNKLKELLNKKIGKLPNCGESWEISGIENDISVVVNGFLKGNSLEELIEVYMSDLVGEKAYDQFGIEFPLLIKYIDAKDKLSIQVHPNDELAKERHGTFGKTEMWFVIHAEEGAKIVTGFNRQLNKQEYLGYFKRGKIEEILNYESVKAGDVFFIPAGCVHAIGGGVVLAEIQQTSDATYRIFDYNRLDDHGKPRELHTELALDAIDFKSDTNYRISYETIENIPAKLVECQYFTTNILSFSNNVDRDFTDKDSFVVYMCIEGDYNFNWDEGGMTVKKGETILVPALINSFSLDPLNGHMASLLEIYL
jgi:mannose-6-phosphate isomerase